MKIPSKVIIAGITWDVENDGPYYGTDGNSLYGEVNYNESKIRIANMVGWIDGGKDIGCKVQSNIKATTLFHELWHIYCDMAKVEELNTEQNANLFGAISFNRAIEDQNNIARALGCALTVMIECGIKVLDIDKSVLEYYIYSTKLEYK